MYSLTTLRDELVGVRLSPANQTLWNEGGVTINRRARLAINEALNLFEFYEVCVFNSINPTVRITVLPKVVQKISRISAIDPDTGNVLPVRNYRHVPTVMTNLLYIDGAPSVGDDAYFEMQYETRVVDLQESYRRPKPQAGPIGQTPSRTQRPPFQSQ